MLKKLPWPIPPHLERWLYIFIFVILLAIGWWLSDFVLVKEEVFVRVEAFAFQARTELEVKAKIKKEVKRFQSTPDPGRQICALVHMLECNYYLLYNRNRAMDRYYDFIKLVLHPTQRNQLKDKDSYIRQAKRYLKRKRNLDIQFSGYNISYPRFYNRNGDETAEVLVLRVLNLGKGEELFKYHFRKYSDNRYYLYFVKENNRVRYRFQDTKTKKNMPPKSSQPGATQNGKQ